MPQPVVKEKVATCFKYVVIVPLQLVSYFLINFSKLFVEGMVSSYVVPRMLQVWLVQGSNLKNSNCQQIANSDTFKMATILLLVSYISVDCFVVGMRRYQPNYELVTFDQKIRQKIATAKSDVMSLPVVKRIAVIVITSTIFALYEASLYFYSVQSQREFIKEHPDFMSVKTWNDNPYKQTLLTLCLVLASAVVNFFESLHNVCEIARDPRMVLNIKVLPIILNSLTLAFSIRLFVLGYVRDNHISAKGSLLMQALFVIGTVGFGLISAGFSFTMDESRRYILQQSFAGKNFMRIVLAAYYLLATTLYQALGIFTILTAFVPEHQASKQPYAYCEANMNQALSVGLFVISELLAWIGIHLFINFIRPTVFDGFKKITNALSCCSNRQRLFVLADDREGDALLSPAGTVVNRYSINADSDGTGQPLVYSQS